MPVAAMRAAGLGEVRRWKLHESTRNFIPLDMQILNVLFWDLRSVTSSSPGPGRFRKSENKTYQICMSNGMVFVVYFQVHKWRKVVLSASN